MSTAERHCLIAQAAQEAGTATVAEFTDLTGASEMTIRRDLDHLAAQGVLERFRGGARTLLLRGDEPPSRCAPMKPSTQTPDRGRGASLIADGETVPLDSCTTCLEVARLPRGRQVTVMPLSLRAINVLSDTPNPASGAVTLLGE